VRALVVTGLTHFGKGGVERETERLLSALVERGVETGFVVDRAVDIANVSHFPITYPPGPRAADEVAAATREFRPDVVHLIGGGFKAMRATARAVRVPWLLTVHNLPPNERSSPVLHGNDRLHYGVRTALSLGSVGLWTTFLRSAPFAKVVVHSSAVRRDAVRLGCPSNRIELVPLGAELEPAAELAPGERGAFPIGASPRIATVAGLIHHKGIHDFLVALTALRQSHPKIHYAIVGAARDPLYHRFLLRRIAEHGLASCVSVVTDASNAVRDATVASADVYVQPSHEEGFCLTFAEGLARVVRVIGTDAGAMPELGAEDPAVRVVPPRSPRALELATSELVRATFDDDAVLAARRTRLAARFSWARHAEAHLELYRRVAARSSG
jgi:glycosyltransferase involved in cell wall biosynthesis